MDTRGVFFDLYGTLLLYGDMKAAWSDWLSEFFACLQRHGLSLSEEQFAKQCDRFFGKDQPTSQDGLTVFERRILALCCDLSLSLAPEDIRHIANHIANAWQGHVSLDPHSIPTLQSLREHKTLALISNFDHPPHVRRVISAFRLDDFFEVIVISGEIGIKKPDPEIFRLALEKTGLGPEEVVYVGDTEEDVAGARAAAIRPISIRRELAEDDGNAFDFTVEETNRRAGEDANSQPSVRTIASLLELTEEFL
jgi:putative hydrolase of the HAD superfamily